MGKKCKKKSFLYYGDARIALRLIKANPVPIDGKYPKEIYRCPGCGAFHLTSTTQKEFKQKQRSKK